MTDGAAIGISFAYVLSIVGLAEGLRRAGRISFDLSRKIIHVGIGTWILPTVLLFHSRWMAAAPPAVFVLLNLLSLRGKWTRAMDAEAGANLGTVLFPLSFVILLCTLWNAAAGKAAIAAGLLSLAWGTRPPRSSACAGGATATRSDGATGVWKARPRCSSSPCWPCGWPDDWPDRIRTRSLGSRRWRRWPPVLRRSAAGARTI